jgi:hypothetical protein
LTQEELCKYETSQRGGEGLRDDKWEKKDARRDDASVLQNL